MPSGFQLSQRRFMQYLEIFYRISPENMDLKQWFRAYSFLSATKSLSASCWPSVALQYDTCLWTCNLGFKKNESAYTAQCPNCTHSCVPCPESLSPEFLWGENCSVFVNCGWVAASLNVTIPENAHWTNSAQNQPECSWSCNVGYAYNIPSNCCSISAPGYNVSGREWVPGACSTRCSAGLYSNSSSDACIQCAGFVKNYLGIDVCQRLNSPLLCLFSG